MVYERSQGDVIYIINGTEEDDVTLVPIVRYTSRQTRNLGRMRDWRRPSRVRNQEQARQAFFQAFSWQPTWQVLAFTLALKRVIGSWPGCVPTCLFKKRLRLQPHIRTLFDASRSAGMLARWASFGDVK